MSEELKELRMIRQLLELLTSWSSDKDKIVKDAPKPTPVVKAVAKKPRKKAVKK